MTWTEQTLIILEGFGFPESCGMFDGTAVYMVTEILSSHGTPQQQAVQKTGIQARATHNIVHDDCLHHARAAGGPSRWPCVCHASEQVTMSTTASTQ